MLKYKNTFSLKGLTIVDKTNVMRYLDSKKINYIPHEYDNTLTDGESIAKAVGQNPLQTFKTLVVQANTKEYFVFVVPVCNNLDLKKGAKAVGVKSIAMIKQKELLPLTGYIHGGCSPIGMKKLFKTVIHESCLNFETIMFSAGRVGYQVEMNSDDLINLIGAKTFDIINKD